MKAPTPGRRALRWIVLALALLEGGWLAFDGGRALLVGDYVTPSTGRFAGQLGPWAGLVSAASLEPRSTLVKSIHLALGATWLVVAAAFALGAGWALRGMLACAAAALWYLPFGTVLSVVQIVLLLLLRRSGPGAHRGPRGGSRPGIRRNRRDPPRADRAERDRRLDSS